MHPHESTPSYPMCAGNDMAMNGAQQLGAEVQGCHGSGRCRGVISYSVLSSMPGLQAVPKGSPSIVFLHPYPEDYHRPAQFIKKPCSPVAGE